MILKMFINSGCAAAIALNASSTVKTVMTIKLTLLM